jgi:hypothetical protein
MLGSLEGDSRRVLSENRSNQKVRDVHHLKHTEAVHAIHLKLNQIRLLNSISASSAASMSSYIASTRHPGHEEPKLERQNTDLAMQQIHALSSSKSQLKVSTPVPN